MAAYADGPRLQDLLESRVRRHTWDGFDLSSREFSAWFDMESNHLWVWLGKQTDLPVEHPPSLFGSATHEDPLFGARTHTVRMPNNQWFGRFQSQYWEVTGEKSLTTLAREAASDFVGLTDDPTGHWLGMLYQLFPDHRSTFVLDQPHTASAFLPGDKIEIAWLPWDVFLTSAKAIERLLEQEGLSLEPAGTDDEDGSCEREADSKTSEAPPSDPPGGPHVSVDRGRGKIAVDGEEHDGGPEWCSILGSLIEADGHYVTGPKMQELPGCKGKKIWKAISDIEEAMPRIKAYLKHEGNKGYRLLNGWSLDLTCTFTGPSRLWSTESHCGN